MPTQTPLPATQLFLPATTVTPLYISIALDALPSDADLDGDPPERALIEDIRALRCLLQPIILITHADRSMTVADGRRRIKGARQVGLTHVAAVIFPVGWIAPHAIALKSNYLRGPNPVSDLIAIEAAEAAGADEHVVCVGTGLTPAQYRAISRLKRLIPNLREALLDGTITSGVAREAAGLTTAQQETLAETLAAQGRLQLKDVRATKRVAADAALAQLPVSLFDTPSAGTDDEAPWQEEVMRLLLQTRARVPTDERTLRARITAAIDALGAVSVAEG